MKTKKLALNALALTLSLSSCASYKASPLCNPSGDLVLTARKDESISIISKTFNHYDCKQFLDRDVLAEGYQPVQIYIRNDSDNNYIFSLSRISLPIAKPEEVAEKVHTSTVGRVVGYSVGALFLWPFVIPAIVDGIKSSNANDALDNDFAAKAARDRVILSRSQFNALIFVPIHAYQNPYNLTLIDYDSKQAKTFTITSNE